MKLRILAFIAALLLLTTVVTFSAQSGSPVIQDVSDFLKSATNMPIGEVAGVATNSKGHVFIYERTGTLETTVGTARTFPHGSSKLLEFDQNGKYVRELGHDIYAFAYAQSVRIDPQDNIWVVDQYSNMVVKLDPDGRVLLTFGRRPETSRTPNVTFASAAPAPAAGGAGGGGNRGGAPPLGAGGGGAGAGGGAPRGGGGGGGGANAGQPGDSFNRPTDVAWDSAGNIFVADGFGNVPRILKMDKNGKFVKTFGGAGSGPGQFNMLASIVIDRDGNLYAADKGNNRIQVFDNNGTFKSEIKNVGSPAALCITQGSRQVLFSSNSNTLDDLDHGEIYMLSLDGKISGSFGTAGHALKEFSAVNSLDCRTEDTLFAGELGNWRVQKIKLGKK
jgi:hypothetical protein